MRTDIPEYIEHRIRQPIPDDLCIVKNSIPVISFGDPSQAKVVTVSINPSDKEFLNDQKEELVDNERRFETLTSLDISNLEEIPITQIEAIYQSCLNYFNKDNNPHNPYKKWFNPLEKLLNNLGVSYYNGSACHLDLVQWATSTKWNDLGEDIQKKLLQADVPFLKKQLENNNNIEVILINGRTTFEAVKNELGINLNPLSELLICQTRGKNQNYQIFKGLYKGRVRVIAWSAYLQNLRCRNSATLKSQLATKVMD